LCIIANLVQANKNHVQDLQTAHDEYTANASEQAARLQRAEEKAKDFELRSEIVNEKVRKAEMSLAEKEKEKEAVQGELDDLLMVFSDLEAKVTKYKEKLKALGEIISDDEEDEEDEDEEDDVD
jgi:intracellular protein transport protein USO1